MLPRWERHWWQKTEPLHIVPPEPTVWVDPSLYEERPSRRLASGTLPPPSLVGAHCTLDDGAAETRGPDEPTLVDPLP